MNDREVVDAFVAHLRRDLGHSSLSVDRRPDEDNRDSSDIDAIAGPFAIEHTSIDTLPNQRRDTDWFMRAVGGLEQELPGRPPFRLELTIEYSAIERGQDWAAIRVALKNWIANEALLLPDGTITVETSPRIPFRLHVTKSSERQPGVFFARYRPEDNTLPARVKTAFERKAGKLARYHKLGKTTILLVENGDIALMSVGKMLDAIRAVYSSGPPRGVDQVWYADTSIPFEPEFSDFTPQIRKSFV